MSEHETPSAWRKSSFSQGGDCVEWSYSKSAVYLRDSKDPSRRTIEFTHSEWRAFIEKVKSGDSDFNTRTGRRPTG